MPRKSRPPKPSRLLRNLQIQHAKHHALAGSAPDEILTEFRQDAHFSMMALEAQAAASETFEVSEESWAPIAKLANLAQFAADYGTEVLDEAEARQLETGCRWMQQIADRAHEGRGWHATRAELSALRGLVTLLDDVLPRFSTWELAMGYTAMNQVIDRLRAQRGGAARCEVIGRNAPVTTRQREQEE